MMTEKEARTKWCPHGDSQYKSRQKLLLAAHDLKIDNIYEVIVKEIEKPPQRCIASDCMMWRYESNSTGCCGLRK